MAFLDNSGDIILDAVLTEDGRKLMAQGNFRITKFALGDDEINYDLYDTGHPSGSAYYDLEILQTPVMEASTAINANINYGLLSIPNPNILHMPSMKRNQLIQQSILARDKVYYLAYDDGTTYDALVSGFGGANGGGRKSVLLAGDRTTKNVIVLETGIDNDEITPTQTNKQNYIAAQGLTDAGYTVSVDSRFISVVYGPSSQASFANVAGSGKEQISLPLEARVPNQRDKNMRNHMKTIVRAVPNNVVKRTNDTKADTTISVIAGPRSGATALSFGTPQLALRHFRRFGTTGATISGASGTYRYIDTMVKIYGATGAQEQLPIRIIQKE
tara:strand:+ start:2864 stop:3853 length:990 start_codon:yes stop_codon:yes gene_type:complete